MQQAFGTTVQAQGAQGAAGSMPGGLPASRDLFRVTKDWDNAPEGYKESDAPRALEIRRLIRAETMPKISPPPIELVEAVKEENEEQAAQDAEKDKKEVEQKEEKNLEAGD